MSTTFCALASGSSGNSLYIGTEYTNILLDAGLSGKALEERLYAIKKEGSEIDALFITHEHTDHIMGAGVLSRRYDIPIYATPGTWEAMDSAIGSIRERNRRFVYAGEACAINDVRVTPFPPPHDAAEPVGFTFHTDKHKISVATDLGCVTDQVKEAIADSDVMLLEANHDPDMLRKGPYPMYLKKRILSDEGHICNQAAGEALAQILCGRLKHVFLGHLSAENNDPHLAYETVLSILNQNGISPGRHLSLDMASRHCVSRKVVLA